jgi:hypothetical protein
MRKKMANKFGTDDAQIVVTEMPGSRAGSNRSAFHIGVICGDDAATFILKPEVGTLFQRALEKISDGRHRRH